MFDALEELSDLSLSLQQSTISLPKAHRLYADKLKFSKVARKKVVTVTQ
jgi:hypothetical protein